ncbi:MAG: hypothetical protein R3F48_14250 [Candidatus Zixiibacteriota bacterium]
MCKKSFWGVVLVAVGLAVLTVACSSPDENGITNPAGNPGLVVLDTITEPIIPVDDQATKTLTADLSGIPGVVEGRLVNIIIVCSNLGAYDYPLAAKNRDIDAWVLLNDGQMHISNGFVNVTFKHSLEEYGLSTEDYISDNFIFSFKTVNIEGLTPGYAPADFKIFAVVSFVE